MVVPERKAREIAVEIKYYIAINIHEVVALALLGINKPLDLLKVCVNAKATYLVNLIKVVGLNIFESFLVVGPWELRILGRLSVVVGVLESQEVYYNR